MGTAALFADIFQLDATRVFKDMQVPTVMRLRAESEIEVHPLLEMRLARMAQNRDRMKDMAMKMVEGVVPVDTPAQTRRLAEDLSRAQMSCMRVLECSDDMQVKRDVAVAARAIGSSIEVMAGILAARRHVLADAVMQESRNAMQIAQFVDDLAQQMKEDYARMKIVLASPGERKQMDLPADAPN